MVPILEAAEQKNDRFLQHAIAYALYEIGDATNLPPSEASETARVATLGETLASRSAPTSRKSARSAASGTCWNPSPIPAPSWRVTPSR